MNAKAILPVLRTLGMSLSHKISKKSISFGSGAICNIRSSFGAAGELPPKSRYHHGSHSPSILGVIKGQKLIYAIPSLHESRGSDGDVLLLSKAEEAKENVKTSSSCFNVIAVLLGLGIGNCILNQDMNAQDEEEVLREEDLEMLANPNRYYPRWKLSPADCEMLCYVILGIDEDEEDPVAFMEELMGPMLLDISLHALKLCKRNEDVLDAIGEPIVICMNKKNTFSYGPRPLGSSFVFKLRFEIKGSKGKGTVILKLREEDKEGKMRSCLSVYVKGDSPREIQVPFLPPEDHVDEADEE